MRRRITVLKWIESLFGTHLVTGSENDLQGLKLELAERDKLIAQLKADLERQRRQAGAQGAESIQVQLEQLFAEAAMPMTQLQTQAYLLDVENRPVQARDVLTVARRLARVLEDHGLRLENRVGEHIPFDPNLHERLGAGPALRAGQEVIIRFAGVGYRGKLLRKAGIEPVEER
jgi:molecular chaperone GrpE (heat shock protein)